MANLNISGYTFSTTSVPTSPALKVVSGTDTVYVNLTTGQRPSVLSEQKVFTVSTSNYSFLRPYVTSTSRTGYSGVSNNSTSTTGYAGVSNNSTSTTGYTGLSSSIVKGVVTDYFGGTTYSYPFAPNADYFNNVSLSGMTNWSISSTKANSGSHSITETSITGTKYRSAYVSHYVDNIPLDYSYYLSNELDTVLNSSAYYSPFSKFYSLYSSTYKLTPLKWTLSAASTLPISFTSANATSSSTIPINYSKSGEINIHCLNTVDSSIDWNFTVTSGTQSFYSSCFGSFKISRRGSRFTFSYTSTNNLGYGFIYRTCYTGSAPSESTILFPRLLDLSYTVSASTSTTTIDRSETASESVSIKKVVANKTATVHSYKSKEAIYVDDRLSSMTTFYDSYVHFSSGLDYYGNDASYFSVTDSVTYSAFRWDYLKGTYTESRPHYSIYATDTASSGKTYSSSSTAIANLSNTTGLTKTTTRYSSSVSIANLSSTTGLTQTTTRYSSSTAIANLSSTTGLNRSINI